MVEFSQEIRRMMRKAGMEGKLEGDGDGGMRVLRVNEETIREWAESYLQLMIRIHLHRKETNGETEVESQAWLDGMMEGAYAMACVLMAEVTGDTLEAAKIGMAMVCILRERVKKGGAV
jgi:hypothetical protein